MINLFKSKIKVVTHDGSFHADDVFTCAALSLWAERNGRKIEIIRTRDENLIKRADIVLDVGMEYDPEKNKFDHHQKGGAGERGGGTPYASLGLVWKKYGEEICGGKEVASRIEEKLVMPIDARDNGVNLSTNLRSDTRDYLLFDVLKSFRPTWKDSISLFDQNFIKMMDFARSVLKAEIHTERDLMEGEELVLKEVEKQNSPEVLVLNEGLPWEKTVSEAENIKFVVYPDSNRLNFCAEAARSDLSNFKNRAYFPENWRGLSGDALIDESGVKDAIFCTNNGWLVVVKSKEGAIEMAKKALQISSN